jgi:nicotinic acid phosphoribosyltransferase
MYLSCDKPSADRFVSTEHASGVSGSWSNRYGCIRVLRASASSSQRHFLENLQFSKEEIDWLRQNYRFTDGFLDYLARLRFTGDVDAMPEGTIFFANEPIIRVIAPLPEAQLVETRLIKILTFNPWSPPRLCEWSLPRRANSRSISGCGARMERRPV